MRADPIATVAAPMPAPREPSHLTCAWSPWGARVDEGWVRGRAAYTYSYPSAFHPYFVSKTQESVLQKPSGIAKTSAKWGLLAYTALAGTDTRHPSS